MNKRKLGNKYEEIASLFMQQHGYRILKRNYRTRLGEIDIIALENGCLCFVEVKYRSSALFGYPAEAVTKDKQKKIIAVALMYIKANNLYKQIYRFDVVEIMGNHLNIIKDCFREN